MWHPFAFIHQRWHAPLLIAMLLCTVAAFFALDRHGSRLTIAHRVEYGILSLEFAKTGLRAQRIYEAWQHAPDGSLISTARDNLYWDFGFIAVYAITFSFAGMLAAKIYRQRGWKWWALIGTTLTLGLWLAAGCDVMENCALLLILEQFEVAEDHCMPIEYRWLPFAAWCAAVKFTLIGMGLAVAFPAIFVGKRR